MSCVRSKKLKIEWKGGGPGLRLGVLAKGIKGLSSSGLRYGVETTVNNEYGGFTFARKGELSKRGSGATRPR
jgi:hypothetical protein